MENKEKNIENLFRENLKDFKEPISDQDWINLDSRMSNPSFFKFNIKSFNIYYTSIVLTAALTGTITLFNSKEEKVLPITHDKLENTVKNTITEKIISEKDPTNHIVKNNPKKEKENTYIYNSDKALNAAAHSKPKIKNDITEKSGLVITNSRNYEEGTVNNEIDVIVPIKKVKSSQVIKKTVYIAKRDTIYNYDTIRYKIKKKRKGKP